MKKIYLLEKGIGSWALAEEMKHAKNFLSKTESVFTRNIFRADVIYSVWFNLLLKKRYYYLLKFLKRIRKVKIIVTITNESAVYTAKKLDKLRAIVDYWILPNKKMYNFLKTKNLRIELIPHYINKDVFKKANKTKKELCRILDIDYDKINGKFLIGSFQRDSLGRDLTKPKWQKNPDLLLKILKKFPKDDILLILAGPRRHYLINKCREHGIPYLFYGKEWYIDNNKEDLKVNNLENDKLSLLYNLIDVYIVTSKSEGGPKAVLETALTKTFIVSTDVGCAPDILHRDLIYNEAEIEKLTDFLEKISKDKNKKQEYIDYNYKAVNLALEDSKLLEKYKSFLYDIS